MPAFHSGVGGTRALGHAFDVAHFDGDGQVLACFAHPNLRADADAQPRGYKEELMFIYVGSHNVTNNR